MFKHYFALTIFNVKFSAPIILITHLWKSPINTFTEEIDFNPSVNADLFNGFTN